MAGKRQRVSRRSSSKPQGDDDDDYFAAEGEEGASFCADPDGGGERERYLSPELEAMLRYEFPVDLGRVNPLETVGGANKAHGRAVSRDDTYLLLKRTTTANAFRLSNGSALIQLESHHISRLEGGIVCVVLSNSQYVARVDDECPTRFAVFFVPDARIM